MNAVASIELVPGKVTRAGTVRLSTPPLMFTVVGTEAALVIVISLVADTAPEVALMVTLPAEAAFSIFSLPSFAPIDTPVGTVPSMLHETSVGLKDAPY